MEWSHPGRLALVDVLRVFDSLVGRKGLKNINKNLPESEDTPKGHMHNLHLGVRSTKKKPLIAPSPTPPTITTLPTKDVFITVYNPLETIFTNQTGKFTLRYIRGNQYQMIVHEINSGSSWIEPMKNRTEVEMILAWHQDLTRMKLQGIVPKHQVLKKELSVAYSTKICDTQMTFQLVPPDNHCRNLAERAIQTWKDNFVGVLSGTAETFPIHLWCQATLQTKRQHLLLQQSHLNPKISAYDHLYGAHEYNAATFVPIVM